MDDEHATEILSRIFFSSADDTVRSAHIIQHFCLFKQIEHAVLFIKTCILFRLIYPPPTVLSVDLEKMI